MQVVNACITFTLPDGSTINFPLGGGIHMQTQPAVIAQPPENSWAKYQAEYIQWGKLCGGKKRRPWAPRHAEAVASDLDKWGQTFGSIYAISAQGVEQVMAEMQLQKYAGATRARRFEKIRGFVTWLIKSEYLSKDPLPRCIKPNTDPEDPRRALTWDEFSRLLKVAPPYRQLLYYVAVETALRADELRQLKVRDFDKQNAGIRLPPNIDKERTERFVALTPATCTKLTSHIIGIEPTEPLLRITRNQSREFNKDRKRAGIVPKTIEGKANFHSLRHTGITQFLRAGATDAQTQEFGRHATAKASRMYRHLQQDDIRAFKVKMFEELQRVQNALEPCALGSPSSSPAQDIRFSACPPSINSENQIISHVGALLYRYFSAPDALREQVRKLLGL